MFISKYLNNIQWNKKTILSALLDVFFVVVLLGIFTISTHPQLYIISNGLILLYCSVLFVILIINKCCFVNKLLFTIPAFALYLCIVTIFTSQEFEKVFTLFLLSMLMIMIYQHIKLLRNGGYFIKLFIVSVLLFSFVFIAFYYEEILRLNFDERIGEIFGNVNGVSLIFSFGAIATFLLTLLNKNKINLLFFLYFSFFSFFGGSKKSLVIFALIFISFAFYIYMYLLKRKLHKFIFLGLAVGSVVGLIFTPVLDLVLERFIEAINQFFNPLGAGDSSTVERFNMTMNGLYLFFHNSIFGLGSEGFVNNTVYGFYSHSNPIELLVNSGMIGFLIFYSPIFIIITNKKNKWDSKRFMMLYFFALMFLLGFLYIYYYDKVYIAFLSIMISFSDCKKIVFEKKKISFIELKEEVVDLKIEKESELKLLDV